MSLFVYLLAAVGYVVIGVIWSFVRWTRFVNDELAFYNHERQRFLAAHRIVGTEIPDFLRFEWRKFVEHNERLKHIPPVIQNYRGVIAFDVVCWWVSMAVIVVQVVYTALMERLLGSYKKALTSKVDQIHKDLKG